MEGRWEKKEPYSLKSWRRCRCSDERRERTAFALRLEAKCAWVDWGRFLSVREWR